MKWIAIAAKIAITALLGWLLLNHFDFTAAGVLLRSRSGLIALGLGVAVLLGQAAIAGVRMDAVMRLLETRCPPARGLAIWLIGLVVSQTLFTFVAGDAARIWQLTRRGYEARVASSAIVLERALGLVVLLAMVLICEPLLLAHVSPSAQRTGLIVLAFVCAGGIAVFAGSAYLGALQDRLPARLRHNRLLDALLDIASGARHLGGSPKLACVVIIASAFMQLANVLAVFIISRAAGVGLDFLSTAALVLPVLLIATLPISLAGWGVRESSMIFGYGLFGVPPTAALAISIAFGLAMLGASLPGVFFIRFAKQERAVHAA
jgi:glycosyltransferase 2 family protein